MLKPETRKYIQIFLAIAILIAVVRILLIFRGRQGDKPQPKVESTLNPDYYVTPRKLYAYDLHSLKEITKQPVWVKEGYRYTYFPYDGARKRSNFRQEAGLLGPIERLQIKDVVTDMSPGSADQRQIMAVFEKEGKTYAFPVGAVRDGNYRIYADEILFLQDPRALYKHWPAEVWSAIEKREVKPGMNELQASFAVGMGVPKPTDNAQEKLVSYPNGGNPLIVVYRNGKAAEIRPGQA